METMDINSLSVSDRIQICLAFADGGEVSKLCSRYGYLRDNVDADLIERAIREKGREFCEEFIALTMKGVNSRQNKEKLAAFSGLVGYNDLAMAGATNLLGVIGGVGTSILDVFFGDHKAETEAAIYKDLYTQQQAVEAANKAAKTKWYIIGGCVAALIITAVVIIALKRR